MSRPERKPATPEEELAAHPQIKVEFVPTTHRGVVPYVAVRAACGATGIDIGRGMCLIVSAQDNELFVDHINTAASPADMPVLPSPDEVAGARAAVRVMHSG